MFASIAPWLLLAAVAALALRAAHGLAAKVTPRQWQGRVPYEMTLDPGLEPKPRHTYLGPPRLHCAQPRRSMTQPRPGFPF